MQGATVILNRLTHSLGAALAFLCCSLTAAYGTTGVRLDLDPHATFVQFDREYTTITDKLTGVRLSIPNNIFESPTPQAWGNNWQTSDGRLRVATLVFKGRKLLEVFDRLRNKAGRQISENIFDGQNVALSGADPDGTAFIVRVTRKGDEIRGISITYDNRSKVEFLSIIQMILASYEPFSGWGTLAGDSTSDQEDLIEEFRQKVHNIISKDVNLPNNDYSLWPELAFLTRDLSVKTSVEIARRELHDAFDKFDSRKLYTPLWAILPRSSLASLDSCTYKVVSIYGKNTEKPEIRKEIIDYIKNNPADKFIAYAYYVVGDFDNALKGLTFDDNACFSSMIHYAIAHRIISSIINETSNYMLDNFTNNLSEDQISALKYSREIPLSLANIDDNWKLFQKIYLNKSFEHFKQNSEIAKHHLEYVVRNKYAPHADDAALLLGWLAKNDGKDEEALLYFLQTLTVGNGDYIPHAIHKVLWMVTNPSSENRGEYLARVKITLENSLREKTCVKCGDTNFLVGRVALQLGKIQEALEFHSKSVSGDSGYTRESLQDVVSIIQQNPPDRRLSIVEFSDAFRHSPALWYAAARESYREFDYNTAIKLAEKALQSFNITPARLPATTDPKVIESDLERINPAYILDMNMVELPYLVEASHEMAI